MIYVLIASILSAVLYRLGGIGSPFDTKYRDFGVPLCSLGAFWAVGYQPTWWWVLAFGLMFGACTTYHSWLSRLLKYTDGKERWFNYAMHGAVYGIAALPVVWGDWLFYGLRVAFLALTVSLWSRYIGIDWLDEGGRGVLFTISIFLFFI